LRWILMFPAVACAIPGGKTPEQIVDNCGASNFPPLSDGVMNQIATLYAERIAPLVHQRW
jgi:aryl-alcohol dehydrogenase-like predicted oxidoreductase